MEPLRRLALCGGASAALYGAALTARYPLMAGLQTARGSWSTLVAPSWGALAAHVGAYLALTLLYTAALRALCRRPDSRAVPLVAGVWLLCSLTLLGSYPGGESHDLFDYLFRGRMLAEVGASPLAVTPSHYSRMPFFLYIAWHSSVDTYGPVWEYASAAVAAGVRAALQAAGAWSDGLPTCPEGAASCAMLAAYVTGYRLLAVGLAGWCGALIYGMVRRATPALAPAALLAWLWNPVLLIGSAVGAHNELLLLAALLLALSLAQRRRWLLALLALALAAHVKLTALLLAPALGLWMLREAGWRRALWLGLLAGALAAPLSWLLYEPLGGWATLPRMLTERSLYFASSPANLAYRWLFDTQGWQAPEARAAVTRAATIAFAAAAAVALAPLARAPRGTPEPAGVWRAAAGVMLAYLLVGSFWFQHWYLLLALAPASLIPGRAHAQRILPWLGAGALAANVVGGMSGGLLGRPPSRLEIAALDVVVIFGPLMVALVGAAVRRRVRRPPQQPEALAAPLGPRG